jgi:hypothetical protein
MLFRTGTLGSQCFSQEKGNGRFGKDRILDILRSLPGKLKPYRFGIKMLHCAVRLNKLYGSKQFLGVVEYAIFLCWFA